MKHLQCNIIKISALLLFLVHSVNIQAKQTSSKGDMALYFNKPAAQWTEALPIGNGYMGAMIFGDTNMDRIQFNDISLCTGNTKEMGNYQPFGDIYVEYEQKGEHEAYRRVLSLDNALCSASFDKEGIKYRTEYFASHPDSVMVIKYSASKKKSLNLKINMLSAHNDNVTYNNGQALFKGRLNNGLMYSAILNVASKGGTVTENSDAIIVKDAEEVTLILSVGTSFIMDYKKKFLGKDPYQRVKRNIDNALKKSYPELKNNHINDYRSLYAKCLISLGNNPNDKKEKSLDIVMNDYRNGESNPWLEALLFQYGRYLLISSSREGGLPSNLQGLWNENKKPAWYSQYTTNINLEMNYWHAEKTGLGTCHMNMLNWVDNIIPIQKNSDDPRLKTDKAWKAYSTMNIMGGNSGWALHIPGPAWLLQHFWSHYMYTGDKEFLKERAYPLLKEMTEFWEERLIEKDGKLVTPDGWSPEHGPGLKEGDRTPYPGVSYDQEIIYDLFCNYIDASSELNIDKEYADKIRKKREQLLQPKIGKWGQLQEWMEDWDDPNDHHRHMSHLFGVFPGRQISYTSTPELAKAAFISLKARGDKSAGWSAAWKINLFAKLNSPKEAHQTVRHLISNYLHTNLFDFYPPFQIDGNFGYSSGIVEMLLQNNSDVICILPALPEEWNTGWAKGLKAMKGFSIDMIWKNGKVDSLKIYSELGGKCKISLDGKNIIELNTNKNQTIKLI